MIEARAREPSKQKALVMADTQSYPKWEQE